MKILLEITSLKGLSEEQKDIIHLATEEFAKKLSNIKSYRITRRQKPKCNHIYKAGPKTGQFAWIDGGGDDAATAKCCDICNLVEYKNIN